MCNGCWVESILRPGVLKRPLSHKWLRWYLPTFLFNDGLFTLIYIASFIVLVRSLSSLPIMLKFSAVALCHVHWMHAWMGDGLFRCKYGIQAYFKGNGTIKQTLMKPKDQYPKDNKSGLIYSYKCQDIKCGLEYIGGTARILGDRHKEHLKGPSSIHVHIQHTWHNATAENFNIIGREDRDLTRTIKEAIYIRVNNPSLNRNVGKYHLSHLWDRGLFNTPGLKIGSTQHPLHIHNNGLAQTIPTNNNSPLATGIFGHALNPEHVLRDA